MINFIALLEKYHRRSARDRWLALRDGLSLQPQDSGPSADFHQFLLDYFQMHAWIEGGSFRKGFRGFRPVAWQLAQWLEREGQASAAELIRALLDENCRSNLVSAQTSRRLHDETVERALSEQWPQVQTVLWALVRQHAATLAYVPPGSLLAGAAQVSQVEAWAVRMSVHALLDALFESPHPCILAGWVPDGEDQPDVSGPICVVPVVHQRFAIPVGPAAALPDEGASSQLRALYLHTNGAGLFVPQHYLPAEPGLVLIPDRDWAQELEHIRAWSGVGGTACEPSAGVDVLVPLAKLPGDADCWVVPLVGPHAGAVLLAQDFQQDLVPRYTSVAHFLATLCLLPHEILSSGGYVSYNRPASGPLRRAWNAMRQRAGLEDVDPQAMCYPCGYRDDRQVSEPHKAS